MTKPKRNKYGAKKTVVDGIKFDSKLESRRYIHLKRQRDLGHIKDLDRQIDFPVQWPGIEGKDGLLFTYRCDFIYTNEAGERIVEDVKGKVLGEFRLKKKGVRMAHGVDVHIVTEKRVPGLGLRWHMDGKPEDY